MIEIVTYINDHHECDLLDLYEDLKLVSQGAKIALLAADEDEPRDPLHSVHPYGVVIVLYKGDGPTSELKRKFLEAWNENSGRQGA